MTDPTTAADEMPVPPMIRLDGSPYDSHELAEIAELLESQEAMARQTYRNSNAAAIARHDAGRILVTAGPGTGKSHLFMERIRCWSDRYPAQSILVSSFVRKLVVDLSNEVRASKLSDEQKVLVEVSTLHRIARSIVERNGGTQAQPMAPHIRMIGPEWQDMVFGDAIRLHPEQPVGLRLREFHRQYHELMFSPDEPWPSFRDTHQTLERFYNAMGFAESIVHAIHALTENPELLSHALLIFDEFQDFNTAEERLVQECMGRADSVLLAGDDDQAIYQELKSSHPEIIRGYYAAPAFANAMLPYCSRSAFHICMAAAEFLKFYRAVGRIDKVYLPLDTEETATAVQIVSATSTGTTVDYIQHFIAEHQHEIEERRDLILSGQAAEPYLLLLSYERDISRFLHADGEAIKESVEAWRLEDAGPGRDHSHVRIYYRHATAPLDNFTMRKVIDLEGVNAAVATSLIGEALEAGTSLSEIEHDVITSAGAKCRDVMDVIESTELPVEQQAQRLAELIHVLNVERLARDLTAFPIGQGTTDEDDDAGDRISQVSPVELLTMTGAKGLSADHVIVLGADATNMGRTSPELFFVALTRARTSLHLVFSWGARGARDPHEFVSVLPEQHCQYQKVTSEGITTLDGRTHMLLDIKKRKDAIRYAKRQ